MTTIQKRFKLDQERCERLEKLASLHGGNQTDVIRSAIDLYWTKNHHVVDQVARVIEEHGRTEEGIECTDT